MEDSFSTTIELPSDVDGFCLLKCDHCNELFKLEPDVFQDEGVLNVYCPRCGLAIQNYLTDEVVELAERKVNNIVQNMIAKSFGKLKNKFNHGPIKIKVKIDKNYENELPLKATVDSLAIVKYPCCNRKAKISPLLSITENFCPLCGVSMLNIDKPELQKVIYRFKSAANRYMQSHYQDWYNEIVKFLNHIDNEPIIKEYINSCGECDLDITQEIDNLNKPGDYAFPLGKTEDEEVRNIVAFLRYVIRGGKDPFIMIPYSIEIGNRKYQDMLKVFNERVVHHLIEHIGDHLVEISIDMGLSNNTNINVSGSNNMVNIATDNGTINNGNIDINELIKSIDLVRQNIKSSDLKESDQQDINESLEVIQEDVTKTGTLGKASMVAFKAMRGIQVAGSLAESMRSLYEFAGIASKLLG